MLILSERDVKDLYAGPDSVKGAIRVIADPLRELGKGNALAANRLHLDYPR